MIGLVLAGGHSRRFGSDKALFHPAGTVTTTELAVSRLAPLCSRVIVAANDHNRAALTAILGSSAQVITDPPRLAGQGPLAGIAAALSISGPTATILMTPCDYPSLTPATLTLLAAHPGHYLQSQGHQHYCLACFTIDQVTLTKWLVDPLHRRLRDFLTGPAHCKPLVVPGAAGEFHNMNYQRSYHATS